MQVRVVYHDSLKDLAGNSVEMFYLDDSATAASLLSRLGAAHPEIYSHLASIQLGRGGQSINQDAFLADGDIVDLSLSETRTA